MNPDATELDYCRDAIRILAKTEGIDQYTLQALATISQRLDEIARGDGSNFEKFKGLIARLVVEQDPMILSPELGGRLIGIERSFYARNS